MVDIFKLFQSWVLQMNFFEFSMSPVLPYGITKHQLFFFSMNNIWDTYSIFQESAYYHHINDKKLEPWTTYSKMYLSILNDDDALVGRITIGSGNGLLRAQHHAVTWTNGYRVD